MIQNKIFRHYTKMILQNVYLFVENKCLQTNLVLSLNCDLFHSFFTSKGKALYRLLTMK